jgi:pyruvate dehydrogenase E1 component
MTLKAEQAPSATARPSLLDSIAERAFAQMVQMIHVANHRPDARPGDPKVGGHPASCSSSLHILGALHLAVRDVQDYVCCKPHAAPMDHAYHHLIGLFRYQDGTWFDEAESKGVMDRLRKFPEPGAEEVFQSYHARSDPDSFHFLPSGSVGIPPVTSVYLALAHRYARDHQMRVPPKAHFWSLIGDSEFREGSLLECMPDVAERELGNVTWIIDYNRQNLDGTRIANEKALHTRDCDRIESTARANGWKVLQARHGRFRMELFARPGGEALRHLFEGGLSDVEFQALLFNRDASEIREHCAKHVPSSKPVLDDLSDEEVLRAFTDLGGHDMEVIAAALRETREDPSVPYLLIAHTIKGWGLTSFADPSNHSSMPNGKEVAAVLAERGLSEDDPYALFGAETPEGEFLAERRATFRKGMEEMRALQQENRDAAKKAVLDVGGLPDELGIDLSLYPRVHTQWMWGQLAAKLVRIGTRDEGGPRMAGADKELDADEQRWETAADYILTMSPDVGTSTNIAPILDQRVYGPSEDAGDVEVDVNHPDLATSHEAWTRHIRFEIAEANCMSAVGSFGKMAHYVGLPFFPIMTVYDFFIKRALDQLYYNLYWGGEFVILGTPSGVTLSSEGAQHSWKSDIQIPNLITWEPLYAIEMDWILSDAIKRHMEDTNDGRRGVLIRAVTRAIDQKVLLKQLRRAARGKAEFPAGAALCPAGAGWEGAADESQVAPLPDEQLLAQLRHDVLRGGYYLVDWRGYAGYEPGENVVNVFAMGSVGTEALEASERLLELGIFANVIAVSSPELLLGILGKEDDYAHLREGLGVTADLHLTGDATTDEAGMVTVAGRRVPAVALCDGEAGLLDNIGSIVGVRQLTLAVRKFSKCGRPDQVFTYQGLDADAIVEAAGRALAETALEDVRVSAALLAGLEGRAAARGARPSWRELWPERDAGDAS